MRKFLVSFMVVLVVIQPMQAAATWLCPNNGASFDTQAECNLLCGGVSCYEQGKAYVCGYQDPATGQMVTAPCSLGAVCPLGDYACQNGSCTQPGVCSSATVTGTKYFCSTTNQLYDTADACTTACQANYTIGCRTGTTYNATRNRCESAPTCSSGTYNASTNMCVSTTASIYPANWGGINSWYDPYLDTYVHIKAVNGTISISSAMGVGYGPAVPYPGTQPASDNPYGDRLTIYINGYLLQMCNNLFGGCGIWINPFGGGSAISNSGTGGYGLETDGLGNIREMASGKVSTWISLKYTCNAGDTLSGTTCTHTSTTSTAPICPSGTVLDGTYDVCWTAYTPTCPAGTTYNATLGKCVAACTTQNVTVTDWACSLNSTTYNTEADCVAGCQSTATCTDKWNCPLGPYQCVDVGDPTVYNGAGTNEVTPQMTTYYQNDGQIDPTTGECNGKVLLFNGQPKSCRLAGMSDGFHNCCSPDNEITQEVGSKLKTATDTLAYLPKIYDAFKLANQAATVYNTITMCSAANMVVPTETMFVSEMGYSATAVEAATTAVSTGAGAGAAAAQGVMAGLGVTPMGLVIAVALYIMEQIFLKGCNEEDMMTASYNQLGLCHFVQERCIKNIPALGCVQKANYYCCFQSKLARIVQEQGRKQLQAFGADGGWVGQYGDFVCRGLSPEEFQMLDFSKMDLSEYIADVSTTVQQNLQQNLVDKTQQKVNNL